MSILLKDDLAKLDSEIDNIIPSFELLKYPRNVSLIHLLRIFEDYVRLYSRGNYSVMRNAIDGLHYSVIWVMKYGLDKPEFGLSTKEKIYSLAHDLHEKAMDYSSIWEMMSDTYRGRIIADRDENTITLRYKDESITKFEVSDYILSASFEKDRVDEQIGKSDQFDFNRVIRDIQIRIVNANKIKYTIDENSFKKTFNYFNVNLNYRWQLEPKWDMGGYTIEEFRIFWDTVTALSAINSVACISSGLVGGALDSIIMIKNKDKWLNEILRWSGLNKEQILAILDDLTYDNELYHSLSKTSHITYQPFFSLGNNLLALSPGLVQLSNPERNLWDLVSIKRNQLHSELKNKKEKIWIVEIVKKIKNYGYQPYPFISYRHENKDGEIDLLIVDDKNKTIMNAEMKWLVDPDHIKEVSYANVQILKGIEQARQAKRWLSTYPEIISQKINVPKKKLSQFKIFSIVLSKNTIGHGKHSDKEIGIVTEQLVDWILGDPHNLSLEKLWDIAIHQKFAPIEGKHYESCDLTHPFGNLIFIGKNLGMNIKYGNWTPKDIKI